MAGLSKETIKKEILRSGRDPKYFINNYVKIADPIKGLLLFKTYPFQDNVLEAFTDNRFVVVKKARQLGLSTLTAAYIAWLMLFHKQKNILIVATKLDSAKNLLRKVKLVFENLPEWLMIYDIKLDNRMSFELTNGSQCKAASTSKDVGRSEALSLLVIDEAAYIDNLDELWAGVQQTLATGGSGFIISSPAGVGSFFHKTYVDAEAGTNGFKSISLKWDDHPERDEAWFERECKQLSPRQIAQELLADFNASGDTVIDPKDLEYIRQNVKDPLYKTNFDRNLWMWTNDPLKANAFINCDVSRGDASDYSAFHVFDATTMEQIAEYQAKVTPDVLAGILYTTGKEFGYCMIAVELNGGLGNHVVTKLQELNYPNLYYARKGTGEHVPAYAAIGNSNVNPGFTVQFNNRPLLVGKLEEYIRLKSMKINSVRLYNELTTFVWHNGRPEAMKSSHDDLVMPACMAAWIRDTALIVNQRDIEYKKSLLNSFCVSSKQLVAPVTSTRIETQTVTGSASNRSITMLPEYERVSRSLYPWIYTK